MKTANMNPIPARSSPGSTRTAPSAPHQDGGEKCVTGVNKKKNRIRVRDNITIGTWNVRTLKDEGKIHELVYEMERYQWNLLGLCEMRWKGIGETTTEEGHKVYYSGKQNSHAEGVGFLIHKDIANTVMECRPISSRLITIRLKATPFNVTILQAYAPTTSYDDDYIEDFYSQVQEVIDSTPKKDIIIVQGDWNAKVGVDTQQHWQGIYGPSCNSLTNDRGLRLLEFAATNNLVLANTLGVHKPSRRWTWHSPGDQYHNQIDYIMVPKRFQSGVNTTRTRSFPGADIGSDHNLVLMTFRLRLRKINKTKFSRPRYNLEKLEDPAIKEEFQTRIGGRFAPLSDLDENSMDLESVVNTLNTAILETAEELLGKRQRPKKPWVTNEILVLCDRRRELKKMKGDPVGAQIYREANNNVRKAMKKAKKVWIEHQCTEIGENLSRNNSRKAYQVVKDLTTKKQGRPTCILDKAGKCLQEEKEVLCRWTEYCSELFNHQPNADPAVLDCPQANSENDSHPILREEVEAAVASLKKGKSPGIDNIPGELVQASGEAMITILTILCNKIWTTGIWPTLWTQSLLITLPKKGNLQLCQNYRTISLISHVSKVMLKIILNRLKPVAENIIAEEQAGFRAGRSTNEQIFNLRIICEKHLQHQQDLYHVFIDFKKAFDRVWHAALWATMRKYNINTNLVRIIEKLYEQATSAVLLNGTKGDWFRTTVGVRQGCLLSPTLFNIFLERIMEDALEHHQGTISIGGRPITNLRFADDIDGLAGSEEELASLVEQLDRAASAYGMEISAEKTKIMTNNTNGFTSAIKIQDKPLEEVNSFKYLGSIISDEGSKHEIVARIAQTTAAIGKLQTLWKDKNISLRHKIHLMRTLALSIFLYACETWTLTAELQRRILSTEYRCYRKNLGIRYTDHITNEEIRRRIQQAIGPHDTLLTIVRKRKLKWYGHVSRSTGLAKTILQGTVRGGRRRGGQRKRWEDNIKEWTGLTFAESQRAVEDRNRWRGTAPKSLVVHRR